MIVAIDPGLNGSGFAVYNGKAFERLESLQLWELYEYMTCNRDHVYLIENSNLDKGNYHGKTARANVGKNKAISKLIVNYAKHLNLRLIELRPAGYSKQYTDSKGRFTDVHQKIFLKDTGWGKQSNKDSRAAAAMVLNNLMQAKQLEAEL